MPIPKPNKSETKDAYVSRFMSSDAMKTEFPDEDQRLAVAFESWTKGMSIHNGAFNILIDNMSHLVRFDELDGKKVLVAPVILIKEGVHNGSAGPIYYGDEDLQKSPESWNHKPVVVYHPVINGRPLSAASKTIIEKQQIGILLNARYENKAIKADAWIDIDKANKVDTRIIDNLENNKMMEVSTGLFTDNVLANGTWNGERYKYSASNFRPDHLAILPDQKGACSIADGAGLPRLNNENTNKGEYPMANEVKQEPSVEVPAVPVAPTVENKAVEVPAVVAAPVVETPKVVENKEVPETLETYVAKAPESFKAVLNSAIELYNEKVEGLVKSLVGNANCEFTEAELKAKSIRELSALNKLAAPAVTPTANYSVQAAPKAVAANKKAPERLPDPWSL